MAQKRIRDVRASKRKKPPSGELVTDITFQICDDGYVNGYKVWILPDVGEVTYRYFEKDKVIKENFPTRLDDSNNTATITITIKHLSDRMKYDFVVYAAAEHDDLIREFVFLMESKFRV